MLGSLLLGDLDEAGFAPRGRPQLAVFEALGQPFGRCPQGDAAVVFGFLLLLEDRVEGVAELGPPGAAAVGWVEAEVDGENAQRRAPFAQGACVLQARLRHRLASSLSGSLRLPRREDRKNGYERRMETYLDAPTLETPAPRPPQPDPEPPDPSPQPGPPVPPGPPIPDPTPPTPQPQPPAPQIAA